MSHTELGRDVRRIEDRLSQRVLVNRDRRSGEVPLVVVQVGDSRHVWASSGVVGAGGSSTIYLTANGKSGGESLFTRAPVIFVGRDLDDTPGGIATASGPAGVAADWSIGYRPGEANVDLEYHGVTRSFGVTVTNLTASEASFVVIARGDA
jgi:hypothetical protein